MNRCPEPSCAFFNRVLPNNAKVCPMCGTSLGDVVEPHPPQKPQSVPKPSVPIEPPIKPAIVEQKARPKLVLTLESGREFYLTGESGTIGRKGGGSTPDIDLTGIPNEGVVSRIHARCYWDAAQAAFMVVDQSRNGCYLNGNLLTPGSPQRLNAGDQLQLGQNALVCFKISLQ